LRLVAGRGLNLGLCNTANELVSALRRVEWEPAGGGRSMIVTDFRVAAS
jgi:hypothetical protein